MTTFTIPADVATSVMQAVNNPANSLPAAPLVPITVTAVTKPKLVLMPIVPAAEVKKPGLGFLLDLARQHSVDLPSTIEKGVPTYVGQQMGRAIAGPPVISQVNVMQPYEEMFTRLSLATHNGQDPKADPDNDLKRTERLLLKANDDKLVKRYNQIQDYAIKSGNYDVLGICPLRRAILDLSERIRKEKDEHKGKEPSKPYWLFLTVSPDPTMFDTPTAALQRLIQKTEKFATKEWVKWAAWTYEQRGTNLSDVGKGPHMHMLVLMMELKFRSQAISETNNTFKDVAQPVAINQMYRTAIHGRRFFNYILGYKKDYYKQPMMSADVHWRHQLGLQPFYLKIKHASQQPFEVKDFARPAADDSPLEGDDFVDESFEDQENSQTNFADLNGLKVTKNDVTMFRHSTTSIGPVNAQGQIMGAVETPARQPPITHPSLTAVKDFVDANGVEEKSPALYSESEVFPQTAVEEEMMSAIENGRPFNPSWNPTDYVKLYLDGDLDIVLQDAQNGVHRHYAIYPDSGAVEEYDPEEYMPDSNVVLVTI